MCSGRVQKRPEGISREPPSKVLKRNEDSHVPAIPWVAESNRPLCPLRSLAEQVFRIWITTHDAIERDEICVRKLWRNRTEIAHHEASRARSIPLLDLAARYFEICRRRFHHSGAPYTVASQFHVDHADSAAHIQQACAVKRPLAKLGKQKSRNLVGPPAAVSLQVALRAFARELSLGCSISRAARHETTLLMRDEFVGELYRQQY
jgi:hypothetical protein